MNRRLPLLVAVLAFALPAPGAAAPVSTTEHDCGRIVFSRHSENATTTIKALGVRCGKARRIVRQVYKGNESPLGFSCEGRVVKPIGLQYTRWICRDGERRVSWRKY